MNPIDEALTEAVPPAALVAQELGVDLFIAAIAVDIVAGVLRVNPGATAEDIRARTILTPEAVEVCLRALAAPGGQS